MMNPGLQKIPEGLGENVPGDPLPIASFVRALSTELNRKLVLWAVLRNAEELPEFTRYDIDCLTLPRHRDAFVQSVESCAAKTGWHIAGRIKKYRYTCLMLVKKMEKGGLFYLPLDLFTGLEFRGVSYLSAEEVLKKRIRTPEDIWTLSPGAAAAIMLLKEWLPHGTFNERKQRSVQVSLKTDSESFISTLKSAAGPVWIERIRKREWTLSAVDHKALRRAVRDNSSLWMMGWAQAAWANFLHLFQPSLGRVVCLAGADGSGKTTLAQGLAEKTFKKPFKGARYLHGNIGVLPRFRDMRSALGIERPGDEPVPESQHLQGMMDPIPAWKSVLLASYYATDFFLARLLIRRWRSQWLLTVLDRSFYDYTYQLGHRNAPRWVLNLLSILVPKPDLLLCIEGDAEAMHARKPELTVEEIQIEQNILRELSDRLPFARVLNGRDGVEAMVDAGTQEVFRLSNATLGERQPLEPTESGHRFLFQRVEKNKKPPCYGFQTLEMKGQPLAAVPARLKSRARSWGLFPQTSLKRTVLRNTLCALAPIGLDRLFCSRRELAGELISEEEITELLNRLTELCSSEQPDWLLTWPAQIERKRMYLIFRSPSQNISGVVKIGAGEFNRKQFANEAAVLSQLEGKELSFAIPSVLFQCDLDDDRLALALGNFPVRPRCMAAEETAAAGRQVMTALKQRAGGLTHGDLGAANMLRTEAGHLFILDWENATKQAPPQTDMIALWLSVRQRQILLNPMAELDALRGEFPAADDLEEALRFLHSLRNLAAEKILEVWSGGTAC